MKEFPVFIAWVYPLNVFLRRRIRIVDHDSSRVWAAFRVEYVASGETGNASFSSNLKKICSLCENIVAKFESYTGISAKIVAFGGLDSGSIIFKFWIWNVALPFFCRLWNILSTLSIVGGINKLVFSYIAYLVTSVKYRYRQNRISPVDAIASLLDFL